MLSFPPCKINLGLNVLAKRTDGYHDLETCFYPVPWTDILEIIPGKPSSFAVTGLGVPVSPEDNLCMKACALLKKDFAIPPLQVHLHKIIPSGAGLGGGSSDAAAALKLLNELFALGLSPDRLRGYALQLGSDCPFFVEPAPALGKGKGEMLTPSPVSLKGLTLLLLCPEVHIGTAEAFQHVVPRLPVLPLSTILSEPVRTWKERLTNDFETSVFSRHPSLRHIKEKLYATGALYASMSGSGSSLFGLFDHTVDSLHHFPGIRSWSGELGG